MNYEEIPPITPELWTANLLDAAVEIANKEKQEQRWLAPDAKAWERPEELINVLFDDSNLELFIDEYGPTFVEDQRRAALDLRDDISRYCDKTPTWLDPSEVLADPRWETIRQKAAAFVSAFKEKWPLDS
jgi:hypothetical protein